MLSSVLRSPRAAQVNIAIMRVFVRLRETLALHKDLAHKLGELERKIEGHDTSIRTLFDSIHSQPTTPSRRFSPACQQHPTRRPMNRTLPGMAGGQRVFEKAVLILQSGISNSGAYEQPTRDTTCPH